MFHPHSVNLPSFALAPSGSIRLRPFLLGLSVLPLVWVLPARSGPLALPDPPSTSIASIAPVDSQFFARDDKNACAIQFQGSLGGSPDSVYAKVFTGGGSTLLKREAQKASSGAYGFTTTLNSGLVDYSIEFGSKTGTAETPLNTAKGLLCGDAFVISGQSNSCSTIFDDDDNPGTSKWIRTYGTTTVFGRSDPDTGWFTATHREKGAIGYWGLELARRLTGAYNIPICIINGGGMGSSIGDNLRNNSNPADAGTIYGRLLRRVQMAKLANGIRGILWHQGESDQAKPMGVPGANPGSPDAKTYQQKFSDLMDSWKTDYPNAKRYYMFQIWPNACGYGDKGSDNLLREAQRTLPHLHPNLGIMTTVGIQPDNAKCHYPAAGYAEFTRLISPLVERDLYGKTFTVSITPPDIRRAYYTNSGKKAIALEFDQPVIWKSALASQFYLDGAGGKVASGSVAGNILTLELNAAASATKVGYLDSQAWNIGNILNGANGIPALTFYDVPIAPTAPTEIRATDPQGTAASGIEVVQEKGGLFLASRSFRNEPLAVELFNLEGTMVARKSLAPARPGDRQLILSRVRPGVYLLCLRSRTGNPYRKSVAVF
jgi:hypothetical protein